MGFRFTRKSCRLFGLLKNVDDDGEEPAKEFFAFLTLVPDLAKVVVGNKKDKSENILFRQGSC